MEKDNIKEIVESYNFAKEKGFDGIVIVIETSEGTYEISEHEEGFVAEAFDCVYAEISEIAENLMSVIKGEIEDIRIE